MTASLSATVRKAEASIASTEALFSQAVLLPSNLQRVASEILMLRLSNTLEASLQEIFLKPICGAAYCDGSVSTVKVRCRSLVEASEQFMKFDRKKKASRFVRWLLLRDIESNANYLYSQQEHHLKRLAAFASEIEEIRRIRNHIAHANSGTAKEFREVLETYCGVGARALPVGTFLLSKNVSKNTLITSYASRIRVIVRDLCKG